MRSGSPPLPLPLARRWLRSPLPFLVPFFASGASAISTPMIGWMPASAQVVANSSAPNRLPLSVIATAGIASARHSCDQLGDLDRPGRQRIGGVSAQMDEIGERHGAHKPLIMCQHGMRKRRKQQSVQSRGMAGPHAVIFCGCTAQQASIRYPATAPAAVIASGATQSRAGSAHLAEIASSLRSSQWRCPPTRPPAALRPPARRCGRGAARARDCGWR